jgi:hypothetical protein
MDQIARGLIRWQARLLTKLSDTAVSRHQFAFIYRQYMAQLSLSQSEIVSETLYYKWLQLAQPGERAIGKPIRGCCETWGVRRCRSHPECVAWNIAEGRELGPLAHQRPAG